MTCTTRRLQDVRAYAHRNAALRVLGCCIAISLSLSAPVFPQQSEQPVSAPVSPPPTVRERITKSLEELTNELTEAKAALDGAAAENRPAPEALRTRVDVLVRLDLLYGQILAALDHEAELNATKNRITTNLDKLRANGPTEARPFPFSLLEKLRDQLESETSRKVTRADAADASKASLGEARTGFEQKERARRKAKEALDSNKDESQTPELATTLQRAQLESRVAGEELRLREVEYANLGLESGVRSLQLTFLGEKIDHVAKDTRFAQEGINEYLAQLDQSEFRLNQALEWAQADFSIRDAEWVEVRHRLEASPTREQHLLEEFAARELARRARQREVALIGEQLQALADSRKAWNRRFRMFNENVDDATVQEWLTETRQVVDQIDRDLRINSARLTELRKEATAIDSRVQASSGEDPVAKRWIEEQRTQLGSMIRSYADTVDQLESARRLHGKLRNEISTQVATVTWSERLDSMWQTVIDVWNYELTSVQDSPITVQKVVIGILLLLTGVFASRRFVGWIARRFLPRLGLNEGAVAAIQSLLFYFLLLTVVMISLRIVNVPLTAFTILGGALAIGIGFGSQNIVNNFISGLILLAERPVRVGDLVQIDDLVGVIEHIGPRSTRVRSPENVDIIVPNSSFLEKNVINWTLTDDRYRAHISVGVVYGSVTRDVMRLIRKAIDEHGKVLPKPEPIVLFTDFGDNALVFEAHFWVRMRRMMDRRLIESDIRSRIDSLFREAGIVVAFPQRDVHLDALSPIQVQLVQNAQASVIEAENASSPKGDGRSNGNRD